MQLTTQMQAEIESIRNRVYHLNQLIVNQSMESIMTAIAVINIQQKNPANITELNSYKVRLENLLCETDIKEQVHSSQSPHGILQQISPQKFDYRNILRNWTGNFDELM